ncbi:MAG: sialate O-acetylesterase [Kiritimatiellia bacterium]|jgi:hypothetical protein|nr:sialate O-acetylesterase [Kiritimatiellia bacterium]MDP6847772.1 sialate O-acetylesterase [Kiritimatiellia bacterium]
MRDVLTVLILLLAGCRACGVSAGEWEIPKDPSKFHIFACLGQSNMAGGFKESHLYNDHGQYDPVTDPVPPVFLYKAGGWKPASHPLIKHNKVSFSLPIPFAKKYLELLGDPDVKVGLVTSAYGGKQIGFFVKGNAMYPGNLGRLKGSGTFKGILWHQGESNTTGVDRYVTFKPCLLGIVRDIRSDLDMPGLPFVTGQLTRMSSNSMPQEDHFGSESCGTITRVLADIGEYNDKAAHVRSSNCGLCIEHTRHLVDEEGNATGKTMRMPNDTIHFNRSGLTTMGQRYARAILDYPSFKNNPVRLLAVPGRDIDTSLVHEVSDLSKDRLTFTGKELPDWLTIKPDGSISGSPTTVGEYKGTLTVTDKSGWIDKSDLVIHVLEGTAPAFKTNMFERSPVPAGLEFRNGVRYGFHKTWSSELYEPNNDKLSFSKVDGPDWLTVSPDGTFSGLPPSSDAGKAVTFKVKVADADGADAAEYSMKVLGEDTVWFDSFDYLPEIQSLRVDETFELNAQSPRDVYFPGVSTRNTKRKISDLFIRIGASGHKFGRGSLKSFCILLDGRRFVGKAGDYRFHFRQYGIGKYAQVIVSIYGVDFGRSPDAAVTVQREGKQFYAVPAPVTARGGAKLRKLAEKNYSDTSEAGIQELNFDYAGTGDVLLVFSASVKSEDLDKIKTVKLSKSQKRKRQREFGGIYPPAFQETGAELDDFRITRVLKR